MVQSLSMPLVKLHISNIKPRAFSYPFNPHLQTISPSPQIPTSPLASLANHQMNPHFAFSAIFALGLRGIANKSKLPYGPINSPGVTRETLIKLPTSLESATAQFKRKDSLAREVMGDYFVDHFAGTREHELEVFRRAVTDWEGGSSFFLLSSFIFLIFLLLLPLFLLSSSTGHVYWLLHFLDILRRSPRVRIASFLRRANMRIS